MCCVSWRNCDLYDFEVRLFWFGKHSNWKYAVISHWHAEWPGRLVRTQSEKNRRFPILRVSRTREYSYISNCRYRGKIFQHQNHWSGNSNCSRFLYTTQDQNTSTIFAYATVSKMKTWCIYVYLFCLKLRFSIFMFIAVEYIAWISVYMHCHVNANVNDNWPVVSVRNDVRNSRICSRYLTF